MSRQLKTIFISAVSDEFGSYRRLIQEAIERPGVQVEIQETFLPYGGRTLQMLDEYVSTCDAVIHLGGDRCGKEDGSSIATGVNVEDLLAIRPDLPARLRLDESYLRTLSYTQWEAWLAVYHGRKLYIAPANHDAPRDHTVSDASIQKAQQASQQAHFEALRKLEYYPDDKLSFRNCDKLIIALLKALHDILAPATPDEPSAAPIQLPPGTDFPALKVLIACSRGKEQLGNEIKESLSAFRTANRPTRPSFEVRSLCEESLRRNEEARMKEIVESDLILFLVEGLDRLVEEALALALSKQQRNFQQTYKQLFNYNRNPRIIGVVEGAWRDFDDGWNLSFRAFEKQGLEAGCHQFQPDDIEFFAAGAGEAFCRKLYDSFYPRFTLIHDAISFHEHESLFKDAMNIYKLLIPIDAERDDPDNIREWICDESEHQARANWLDYLLIAHFDSGDVFGVLWCNIDMRNGLGHVPFWGLLEDYRKAVLGVHVAGIALREGEKLLNEKAGHPVAFKGVVFEAESVDLGVFREVLEEACKRLGPSWTVPAESDPHFEFKSLSARLKEGEPGKPSLIESTILDLTNDSKFAAQLDEEMRRFRRFAVYAQGADGTSGIMKRIYQFEAMGFVDREKSGPGDHIMASYTQPPIKPPTVVDPVTSDEIVRYDLPVTEADQCTFSLFLLVKEACQLTAKQVSDWEYDHFLGEQFRDEVQGSGLLGWNDYMQARREEFQAAFTDVAELKNVELGSRYRIAQFIRSVLFRWPRERADWNVLKERIKPRL